MRTWKSVVAIATSLALVFGLSGVTPPEFKNVPKANAATYYFQTGYYMGDGGSSQPITGLGFQPEFIFLKHTSTTGVGPLWVTSTMKSDGANRTCYVSATACQGTTNYLSLNSDGFTAVAATNGMNATDSRITWMAAAGSTCDANGYFCVGKYTATGSALNVTSVGFQPTFVMVKKYATGTSSAARAAMFATDTMVAGESCQLINVNCVSNEITGFLSNGFSLAAYASGATNTNDAGGTDDNYYYVAFRDQTGLVNTGTYTVGGSEVDDTNITGFGNGYTPDAAWVKCRTTTTPQNGTWATTQQYGDKGVMLGDAASAVNQIQKLQNDGFEIGTANTVSIASTQYYWVAWKNTAAWPSASGTFTMKTGAYTGNSTGTSTQTITGVGFTPDLVIVKDTSTNKAMFKTKMMSDSGTTTATLAQSLATNEAGLQDCIRSFNSDGFVIGQSTVCNNNTNTYHYMAFGNAYDPHDRSGAADFAVGCYEGNGIDNDLIITNVGFQPSMVTIKYNTTQYGIQTSSAMGADSTAYFHGAANAANFVQSLDSDGFSLGNGSPANSASTSAYFYWFAFKENSGSKINFDVGSYTGDGTSNRNLPPTASPMVSQPDLVWVKDSSTQAGVLRPGSIGNGTDSTLYFTGSAAAANRIDQFNAIPVGFRVDSSAEVNNNLSTYYYAMWRRPVYTPQLLDWRWFDAENDSDTNLDTTNGTYKTAGDALAAENSVPTGTNLNVVYPGNIFKLRVKITETDAITGVDVKYKLQYDTSSAFSAPTDVGADDSTTETFVYDSDNTDGYADDVAIDTTKLSGSPTAGRHNEDNSTGLGQGSTFDPTASTAYEHEFVVQMNLTTATNPPVASTVYYFRVLFYENSAGGSAGGAGVGGWTVVPLNSSVAYTTINIRTAAAFDLELTASPADVDMGSNDGANDYQYTFGDGAGNEEIVFWDKRGTTSDYNITVSISKGGMVGLSNPGDVIPDSDMTWTSTAASLGGAFASSTSGIAGQNGSVLTGGINAYVINPGSSEGDGGYFFLPTIALTNLSARGAQVYNGTITLTAI